MSTGAPESAFVTTLNARGSELTASNSTVYVGGRFTTVNGVPRASLAAVDATTGALDTGFVNNLSGGIGSGGNLTVQQLVLTRDLSKLLVVFTGRQVNGQDRYGIALINTETKGLLPWRTRLYQDNLQFTGGVTGINAGAISPDDDFFVVGNAWGDRPPIGDTVVAFPIAGGDDVKPRWISRHHDSVYSLSISEKAVYVGGHFGWQESPTSPDPWPGLEDVGYGTGQGISGYALGDAVVNREHVGALNPVDGRALEWNPGSISFEGNKAIEVTPEGTVHRRGRAYAGRLQRRTRRVLRLRLGAGQQRRGDGRHRAHQRPGQPDREAVVGQGHRRGAERQRGRGEPRGLRPRVRAVPRGRPRQAGAPASTRSA